MPPLLECIMLELLVFKGKMLLWWNFSGTWKGDWIAALVRGLLRCEMMRVGLVWLAGYCGVRAYPTLACVRCDTWRGGVSECEGRGVLAMNVEVGWGCCTLRAMRIGLACFKHVVRSWSSQHSHTNSAATQHVTIAAQPHAQCKPYPAQTKHAKEGMLDFTKDVERVKRREKGLEITTAQSH